MKIGTVARIAVIYGYNYRVDRVKTLALLFIVYFSRLISIIPD